MSPHRQALHDLADAFDPDQRVVGADANETPAEAQRQISAQVFGRLSPIVLSLIIVGSLLIAVVCVRYLLGMLSG